MKNTLAHLAVAVKNIDDAKALFELLADAPSSKPQIVESQNVKTSFIQLGDTNIELLEPFGEKTPISNFLDKSGGGIHHLCIETDDFDNMILQIKNHGVRTLGEPSIGAKGRRVIFFHPKDTFNVLIELEETEK